MLVRAIRGTFKPSHATVRVPIFASTVVMWTGASLWSDLVQRALTWEARESNVFINVFFGFPWADVPDDGMSIQVCASLHLTHTSTDQVSDMSLVSRVFVPI
jgi:microcystin degradation protein MlrC